MRKFVLLAVVALAVPAWANTELYTKYETVRQALLKSSLADAKAGAKTLAAAARGAKQAEVAKQAEALAAAASLDAARQGFAPLSDSMIRLRAAAKGDKPAVYYCSMVKKSWLQPKGKIGNPYDEGMAMCGELKEE